MICEKCSAETARDAVFKVIQKGKKKKFLCPTCFDFNQYKKGKKALAEFLGGLLIMSLFVLYGPVPWLFLNIYMFSAMLYLSIVPHELGHVLGVLLVRFKLLEVSFGSGRRLYFTKLFGVYVEFHVAPGGGRVRYVPKYRNDKGLKEFLIYAMGPASNVIIFFILIMVFHETAAKESFFETPAPILSFAFANLFTGIWNLLPFKHQSNQGQLPSDGLSLLRIIQGKNNDIPGEIGNIVFRSWLAYQYKDYKSCKDLSKFVMEKDKENVAAQRLYALAGAGLGEYLEAIKVCQARLECSDMDERARAMTQSNLAYYYLLHGDETNFINALELAEKAMAVCSWDLAVRSNYGGLNIVAGDVDKGIDVLTDKRFKMRPKEDQAEIHCLLAIGWSIKGNATRAKNAINKARKLDGKCVFLPRATEAIGAVNG